MLVGLWNHEGWTERAVIPVKGDVATAVTYVVDTAVTTWRRSWACIFDVGRWLIAKIPKPRPEWLGHWIRVMPAVSAAWRHYMARRARPVVSPRWRMCPST